MKSFIMIKGLFVILLAIQAVSQELTSTLHSTLYDVQIAYVDEMIVFTCVVRGSGNMAWISEEYIGIGGQQLPFAAAEPAGTVRRAIGNNQTVATLVTAVNTGDIMIVSELRIRIKSTYPLASVQCISRGADIATMSSTSFQLAAATSITCDRQFLCPGETTVTCVCATANSSALAWTFNGTRLDFTSNNATLSRRDLPGSNGFVVLTENSIVNGIRVIMSNITVSASSSDVTLTCGNVNQNMMEPITVPMIENCPVSPSGATPTGSDNSGDSTGPIIAAVFVPLILVILVIIAIPIVIILLLKFQTKQKAEEIRSVNQRISEQDTRIQALQKENETLKQTKALQDDQLTGKVDELKRLQQKLDEQTGTIDKLKTENLKLEQKENEVSDLKNSMSLQAEKSGRELEKLQNELNDKAQALKGLPAIMKVAWMKALRTLETKMKEEQKTRLIELKEKLTMGIYQAFQNKGTYVDPKDGAKKGVGKAKMSMDSKDGAKKGIGKAKKPPQDTSVQVDRAAESETTKVEGEPASDLPAVTKTTEKLTAELLNLLVTKVNEVFNEVLQQEEGMTADTRKGASLETAPRKLKESSIDDATQQFENAMNAEVDRILEVGKHEPMLPGQQGSSQGHRQHSIKFSSYIRDPVLIFKKDGNK